MKHLFTKKYLSLQTCMFITLLVSCPLGYAAQKSESKAIEVLQDFIETKKCSPTCAKEYTHHIIDLLKDNPSFAKLCTRLQNEDLNQEQASLVLEELKEYQAIKLLKEFMDTTNYKNTSFEEYAQELIIILQDNPKFADLCTTLQSVKKSKDPITVGTALKKFKTDANLPPCVKDLFNQPLGKLLKVLQTRINK
jgi:hypothetical protein